MAHTFNLIRDRQIPEFEANLVYRAATRHPGLLGENVSKNKTFLPPEFWKFEGVH